MDDTRMKIAFTALGLLVACGLLIGFIRLDRLKAPNANELPIEPKLEVSTTTPAELKPQVDRITSATTSKPVISDDTAFKGQAEAYYEALSVDRRLKPSKALTELAEARATDMERFSHDGYKAYIFNQELYNNLGENLYGGIEESMSEVEARFMASPTHRANIENAKYTHVGIAVRKLDKPLPSDDGDVTGYIIVVFFGGK